MTTLTDDELVGEEGSLPQGLSFHLSQCESCRLLAERLLSVSRALGGLAAVEPPDGLAGRADCQAREALRAGAKLTGRVDIPDEVERELASPGLTVWRYYGRFAAAALILLCVGLYWVSTRTGSRRQLAVEAPAGGVARPSVAARPAGEAGGTEGVTAGQSAPDGRAESVVADTGSETVDQAEEGVEERVVDLLPVGPAPPIRIEGHRHHSYIEAALCEHPLCVRRAHVLPDMGERLIGIGPAFDSSLPVGSTDESTRLLGDE
jgi:hypothetical protein